MPPRGCFSGLLATAAVAFLLIPVQYYVPDRYPSSQEELLSENLVFQTSPEPSEYFDWISLADVPPFDLFLTISLLTLSFVTYICDWIQRKLLERRIIKMNRYLSESVELLREWDVRQEQLEAKLRLVQTATSEYNLLLHLLLQDHQHRQLATHKPPYCYYDKEVDLNCIRNPTIDVLT